MNFTMLCLGASGQAFRTSARMRVFVQQAFKAGRQSVFGVTDSMAVPEFIALLVESGRITDVDEDDLLILDGAEELACDKHLSDYLGASDSMLPNLLYLMVRSRKARMAFDETTASGTFHAPGQDSLDVCPSLGRIEIGLPRSVVSADLEVVGACHAPVSGAVQWDSESGILSFIPSSLLDPGTRHCVYVTFSDEGGQPREYHWTFRTQWPVPCRVIAQCASSAVESEPPRVVVLARQQRCLFAHLRMQIASRLWGAGAQSHDWSRICIEAIDGQQMGPLSQRERDVAVCQLTADVLGTVTYSVAETISEEDLRPVAEDRPIMSYEEYTQQHWAHPHSGYLAIGGKLSAGEEAELLAMVVRAFADPQDLMPESCEAEAKPVPVCALPLPPESREQECCRRVWAEQPVFKTTELGNEAVEALRNRGYVLLRLDEDTGGRLERLYDGMQQFFDLNPSQKNMCKNESYKFLGYRDNPELKKEMFQFRRSTESSKCIFRRGHPDIREHLDAVFTDLAGISSSLLSSVCASVGMQPSKAQLLCESASQPPSTGSYSMSNLTAFRYEAGQANSQKNDWQAQPPCPAHTDIGLVTIIPVCRGAAGLRIFDRLDNRWLDVESEAPPCGAVLFAGETLARLTNGRFYPTHHEVVSPKGNSPRLSCPFQFLANAHAWLEFNDLNPAVVGPCLPACRQPVRADRFVFGLSHMRQSTTYNR